MDEDRAKSGYPLGLRLIVLEKAASAAGLLVLATITAYLLVRGVHQPVRFFIAGELREDPHDRIALWLLAHSPVLPTRGLVALEAVWCIWAVVLGIEAAGLALRKSWAEWLVVVETVAFLPLEALELHHHATPVKWVALAINLLILAYLLVAMVRRRHRV